MQLSVRDVGKAEYSIWLLDIFFGFDGKDDNLTPLFSYWRSSIM
jgi:hypothetical protein